MAQPIENAGFKGKAISLFTVCSAEVVGPNTRFWQAAGLDLLYVQTHTREGQYLLDRLGTHGSCRWLRNHHVFSDEVAKGVTCGLRSYREDDAGNPIHDFSAINRIYAEWLRRGIKPIVEYDFMPVELSATGRIRSEPKDWTKWANLLKAFTANLIQTFGRDEVRTWPLEFWNEPDWWPEDQIEVLYRMYDVFADAVRSQDDRLRVGGPAVFHDWALRPFLRHVTQRRNYVTGKIGTPIDFVSYHSYALSNEWVGQHPLIRPTVQKIVMDVLLCRRLLREFQLIDKVEFHLNEWGMCSNYSRTVDECPGLEYRNTEESALFMAKLVDCLYATGDMFGLLPDMLLYWGFAGEEDDRLFLGQRSLTTCGHLPKPILMAYEMLAKLGSQRLKVQGSRYGESLGLMATRHDDGRLTMLGYNYNEFDEREQAVQAMDVELTGLVGKAIKVEAYVLDASHHNTYRAWERQGRPRTPAQADMEALRKEAKLTVTRCWDVPVVGDQARLHVKLPFRSMVLLEVRPDSSVAGGRECS